MCINWHGGCLLSRRDGVWRAGCHILDAGMAELVCGDGMGWDCVGGLRRRKHGDAVGEILGMESTCWNGICLWRFLLDGVGSGFVYW